MSNAQQAQEYIIDRVVMDPNCGCWLWLQSTGSHGYGNASLPSFTGKQVVTAHRLSYQAFKGEIPDGFEVDHLCRVRSCVNPNHLEAVSPLANKWRAAGVKADAVISDCPRGHGPYRLAGRRLVCPSCVSDRQRKYAESDRGSAVLKALAKQYAKSPSGIVAAARKAAKRSAKSKANKAI